MDITEELAKLMATHDDSPVDAEHRICSLVAGGIPTDLAPRVSWLANHVIGERLSKWDDALRVQHTLVASYVDVPVAVLRNAAVAALMAGEPVQSYAFERRMQENGISMTLVNVIVRIGLIGHAIRSEGVEQCASALSTTFEAIEGLQGNSPVDVLLASGLNNCISAFLEVDDTTLEKSERVRHAIERGANLCRNIWRKAGTWINEERADYLCALAYARLNQMREALEAAERGLRIIEQNGVEEVDRAFLLLEAGRARCALDDETEGKRQMAEASELAARWTDSSLRTWFDEKVASIGSVSSSSR